MQISYFFQMKPPGGFLFPATEFIVSIRFWPFIGTQLFESYECASPLLGSYVGE